MKKRNIPAGPLTVLVFLAWYGTSSASSNLPEDPYSSEFVQSAFGAPTETTGEKPMPPLASPQDTIPLEDRYGDFLNDQGNNPFDLEDPEAVQKNVEYDPETGQYIITETIGNDFFRPPTYMTFEEYLEYQTEQQEKEYFKTLGGAGSGRSGSGRLDPLANVDVKNQLIERLFGGTEVDIRPSGNIDLTFGYESSVSQRSDLPDRSQRRGGFLFDMAIQMNVEGSIGEKLKLQTNYNTQATFDFDNTMKLEYGTDAFGEDDIIKRIEAGNVSLPLQGSLIQGSQSLFGLRTDLQFGRLRLSLVASQQKSEQENITLENGSQVQEYSVTADEYDENRNFFLTHYNRGHFEQALENMPQIKTLFRITKLQVWVTDTRNTTEDIRDIVAIADLGETDRFTNPDFSAPSIPVYPDRNGDALPDNDANSIYADLTASNNTQRVDRVVNALRGTPFNMQQGRDFEKVSARLLSPTEYSFHPQLGFISLKTNIQADQVVGVAFEYTYQGEFYQVGEMAEEQRQNVDTTTQDVLFIKMLKGTIQPVDLPTWDLMMKNIYNIGAYGVAREDFRLGIFYEDPGQGKKQFMPAQGLEETPLLRVFNLDQLNVQLDPAPDGVFDFVDSLTISTKTGRIMFPVLEPFGSDLAESLANPADRAKFVYQQLYDETLFNAREFPELNRFTIEGSYKSSVSSEISLGAFNIPQGSVKVSAGGQQLVEGKDYEVDYNIGRVRILNDAILNSGVPINVNFEDNTLFGFQTKSMLGMRADYDVSKNLVIGGTYLHLFERPYTQKVNIGDDPINNRIYGLDLRYSNEAPWLTKFVDKIPGLSTKEKSNVNFTMETAALKPGHARAINESSVGDGDKGGVVYIDDFEGSVTSIDIRSPFHGSRGWSIASVPQDRLATNPSFPESELKNNLLAGTNRAHLSWYRIDPSLPDEPNPYAQTINQQEIFPNLTPQNNFGVNYAQIFDMCYDPTTRGPYNFDVPGGTAFSAGLDENGNLLDPGSRWGGIMRQMTTNDFQSANVEFVEFWMMSPYLDTAGTTDPNPIAATGEMDGFIYLNFGNISEDILPDSRRFFENGLPGPSTQELPTVETAWGKVPVTQSIVNAFDVKPENRESQDVGLDGLSNAEERVKFDPYIQAISGLGSPFRDSVLADPSNDNFVHYRSYDTNLPVLQRYRRFFGTEGNTPINRGESLSTGAALDPDAEDIDGDRTMNETEAYFQYRIPIQHDPVRPREIRIDNNPFITDTITSADNRRLWYRFQVPLNVPDSDPNFERVGSIKDFRSIRFMRMFFKGFEKPVCFRFATFELVRNQWRRYSQTLVDQGCVSNDFPDNVDDTAFEVTAVNIEENSQRRPFGYVLPPGINREQALGVNLQSLQNEQALSLRVCDLDDGDARGIFKNLNLDMRYFSKLKMFVHGEETDCGGVEEPLEDGDMKVFVRLGSDFKNNFYEYEVDLKLSRDNGVPNNSDDYPRVVWPIENDISVNFELLKQMKLDRNADTEAALGEIYEWGESDPDRPDAKFRIKGNPNLGLVKAVMIGIRNPRAIGDENCTGDPLSVEIWVNELRVFGLDERGGVAGIARLDMQLADFGTMTLSGKATSIGFGALDQQLAERSRESIGQYDIATSLELSKFLPEKTGLKIPFYFQYSNETRNPQYDPYDLDIELKDKLRATDDPVEKDSIKQLAQTVTEITSYNFTNVRKERTNKEKTPMPWDIANFSLTYAFDETEKRDPIVESDVLTRRRGALDYAFSRKVKYFEPLKKTIKSKHLKFISDVNLNPLPNSFNFSTDLDRRFNVTKYRFAGNNPLYNTYYNKQFTWTRNYDVQWDITRSLKFTFFADNVGIIDEPQETQLIQRNQLDPSHPDYVSDIAQYRRDSIWSNIQDFGRTKQYNQQIKLNYKVPTKLFPYLDWVGIDANYQADYGWNAASLNTLSLGNVINNRQVRSINAKFDFEKLYNYFDFLKQINAKQRSGPGGGGKDADPRDKNRSDKDGGKGRGDVPGGLDSGGKSDAPSDNPTTDAPGAGGGDDKKGGKGGGLFGRKDKGNTAGTDDKQADKKGKKKDDGPSPVIRAIIRPLMAVRSVDFRYEQSFSTTIPGYTPKSELFGMNDFSSPGWGFVGGLQPNIRLDDYYTEQDYLYKNWQWFSLDPELNQQVTQTYTEKFNLQKIEIEPFRDFRIDVNAERTLSRDMVEDFRRNTVQDPNNPNLVFQTDYEHQGRLDYREVRLSYMAINTLFDDDLTGLYQTFLDNRLIIANRLGTGSHADSLEDARGYPAGYGSTHPSVFYPAFMAAYTGKDAATIELDANDYQGNVLMKSLPRPNWNLTYNGLSKLGMFEDIFSSFSIKHGYKGLLRVSRFQSEANFEINGPPVLDGNLDYFSRFEKPEISIEESFTPLLGVDMRFKNDISMKAEYKTNRTLRLSKVNAAVDVSKGTELIIGLGYKLKKVDLGFFPKKKKGKPKADKDKGPLGSPRAGSSTGSGEAGDLDITFDFSIRDDETIQHAAQTGFETSTRGNRLVSILPQATYQLNKQLSLRFFFDYRRNVPKTSEGFPRTDIRSGVTVRFSL